MMKTKNDDKHGDYPFKPLVESASWTRQDYCLLVFNLLVKFGNSVQLYMPGVITQLVSCDLGVSNLQEGFLGVVLYVFLLVSVLVAVPLSKRFGARSILFISLYSLIALSGLLLVTPNFYLMLLSRALTGFCVGLNSATAGVHFAQNASSPEINKKCSFLVTLSISLGSAWISFFGWLIMDKVGWRLFVVLGTVPIFLPAAIILHVCRSPTEENRSTSEESAQKITVSNPKTRIVKSSLFMCVSLILGYGVILLLPSIIRWNKETKGENLDDKCGSAVQGNEFLVLTVVKLANIIGRFSGYYLRSYCSFTILQSTVSLIIAVSYSVMVYLKVPGILIATVLLGLSKLCYSIQQTECGILRFDPAYFGTEYLARGSAIMISGGFFGGLIGTAVAAFLDPYVAVITFLVLSLCQVAVVCSMTERRDLEC